MKKILLSLFSLCALGAHADEGMWTLYNLPNAVYEQMKAYGFQLPMEQLYASDNAVKNAVVNFGGFCTGVVVSPDGLVFTNHHCGFDAIRQHSTIEHDYMLNGFISKSYEEELPNEDLFVSFMVDQKDVTDQIFPHLKGLSLNKQAEFVDSVENAWQKEIRQQDSTLRVEVKPFYEGNKYYMTTYRDFEDVRLVFAVPKSMGKFGGETDNWMWPRHTCDFSMFRVYAGADNEPTEYSPSNKPLKPANHLKISLKGVQEGDFTMIMGYPGRTQRFQTAAQLEQMIAVNRIRIDARTLRQGLMWEAMCADPEVQLKYASKYAGSANGWKKWQGEEKAFKDLDIIGRELKKEADFMAWVGKKKARQEAYGEALSTIEDVVRKTAAAEKAATLLIEVPLRIEIVGMAGGFQHLQARDSAKALETIKGE